VAAQIRAEDERSSSEFLRTQRQELYARYLTNETQLERLEIDFLQMVRSGGSGVDLMAQVPKIDNEFEELSSDYSSIALMATPDTNQAASHLDKGHLALRAEITRFATDASTGRLTPEDYKAFDADFSTKYDKTIAIHDRVARFLHYARVELAVG
jgi:hypothetical protein